MKKLIVACVLSSITLSAVAAEVDNRQKLVLNAEQRNLVLNEMRMMLAGTQGIVAALSQNDMDAVAKQARTLGMSMGREAGGHLHSVLPMEFKQLGMSSHQDFDAIAMDAESLKDPKHTLQQLGDAMNKCIACHSVYQISSTK
ncbi:MAG: hypothetical protein HOP20_08960 [Sulfuriferula sp.]|nr:hypothetical protein [Sulfuriferula sp.]